MEINTGFLRIQNVWKSGKKGGGRLFDFRGSGVAAYWGEGGLLERGWLFEEYGITYN